MYRHAHVCPHVSCNTHTWNTHKCRPTHTSQHIPEFRHTHMFQHINTHTRAHFPAYIHTRTYSINAHMCPHMCPHMSSHTHVDTFQHLHTRKYSKIYTHAPIPACIHTHTFQHVYTRTYVSTHVFEHTHTKNTHTRVDNRNPPLRRGFPKEGTGKLDCGQHTLQHTLQHIQESWIAGLFNGKQQGGEDS